MAFTVVQAGTTLQFVATDGTVTPIALPSGVELRQDVPPRWAVYGRYVILVNTPTRPLTIDSTGAVRPLTPLPPRLAAVLSAGAGAVALAATGLPTGVTATFAANPTTEATSALTFTAGAAATVGAATVTITGTGGGVTQTTSISLTVTSPVPAVGFTLTALDPVVRVGQGNAIGSLLQIAWTGGFVGAVTLAATGLPTGVTGAFDINPVTGGTGISAILFTASGTATVGPATITITATATGAPTQTASITLTVDPAVGFLLAASSSVRVTPGAAVTNPITVTRLGGFSALISFAVSGLPTGVTATFSENPVTGVSTILTLTATAGATVGSATVTITGTATGAPTQTVTFSLTVGAAPPFTLAAPTSVAVTQGSTAGTTISIARTGSFTGAGNLTGTYRVRYTFLITDDVGNIICESDYSPISNPVTITAQLLRAANLETSSDPITARRCYRTTTNGSVYFEWVDLYGNVLHEVQDDLADAGLGQTAGPTLGTAPRLTLIAEFRDRLFGVGDIDIDSVVYTETGLMYAWNPLNSVAVPRVGNDTLGVTGLVARREALGVGRVNRLSQIVGTGEQSADGQNDFRLIKLSEETGFLGQESIVVYRDHVYFLWFDGVYEWGDQGIVCLSDGRGGRASVRSWFATDDYFDRRMFARAFAQIDPNRFVYQLFLDDPDGVRHFVEFDLNNRVWYGPHRIDAFRPASAFLRLDDDNIKVPTVGATDGGIYIPTARAADVSLAGQPYGIAYDVETKPFVGTSPDRLQYFGELSVLGRSQPAGTLTITPRIGYLDADGGTVVLPQAPILHTMRKGRERLRRLGTGLLAELHLTHDGIDEAVSVLGIEIDDVHEVGRR